MPLPSDIDRALRAALQPPPPPASRKPRCRADGLFQRECDAGAPLAEQVAAETFNQVSNIVTGEEAKSALLGIAATQGWNPAGVAAGILWVGLEYGDDIWNYFSDDDEEEKKRAIRERTQAISDRRASLLQMLEIAIVNRAEQYLKTAGLYPLLDKLGSEDWVRNADSPIAQNWRNKLILAWDQGQGGADTLSRAYNKTAGWYRLHPVNGSDVPGWWITPQYNLRRRDNKYYYAKRPHGQEYYVAIKTYLQAAMQGFDLNIDTVIDQLLDDKIAIICERGLLADTDEAIGARTRCKRAVIKTTLQISYWDAVNGPVNHWAGVEALKERYGRTLATVNIPAWRLSKAAYDAHQREEEEKRTPTVDRSGWRRTTQGRADLVKTGPAPLPKPFRGGLASLLLRLLQR